MEQVEGWTGAETGGDTVMTCKFLYLDWTPLPSRMTPLLRSPKSEVNPPVSILNFDQAAWGSGDVYGRIAAFRDAWNNILDGLPPKVAKPNKHSLNPIEKELLKEGLQKRSELELLKEWLDVRADREVAVAVDGAGIIAIAVHTESGLSEGEFGRNEVRDEAAPDTIAKLAAYFVRSLLVELHGEEGSLKRVKSGEAVFSESYVSARPVAVEPGPSRGSAVDSCKKLLRTDQLFARKSEKTGIGGAPVKAASAVGFLALSTRFGALVDQVVPTLMKEVPGDATGKSFWRRIWQKFRNPGMARRNQSDYETAQWYSDSVAAAALVLTIMSFVIPFLVTTLFRRWLGIDYTTAQYALIFLLFFCCCLLVWIPTFYIKDIIEGGKPWVRMMLYPRWLAIVSVSPLLLWIGFSGANADSTYMLHRLSWSLDDLSSTAYTMMKPLKAIVWGLPVVGMTLLKLGYENVSSYGGSVLEQERRLKILADLETKVAYAQRFAANIKKAFGEDDELLPKGAKPVLPKEAKPVMRRLLQFDHAKNDIDLARRKISSKLETDKSRNALRTAATVAIGFLLVSQDILGKLEPQVQTAQIPPKRIVDHVPQAGQLASIRFQGLLENGSLRGNLSDVLAKELSIENCKFENSHGIRIKFKENGVEKDRELVPEGAEPLTCTSSEYQHFKLVYQAQIERQFHVELKTELAKAVKRTPELNPDLIASAMAASLQTVLACLDEDTQQSEACKSIAGMQIGAKAKEVVGEWIAGASLPQAEKKPDIQAKIEGMIIQAFVGAMKSAAPGLTEQERNPNLDGYLADAVKRALEKASPDAKNNQAMVNFFEAVILDAASLPNRSDQTPPNPANLSNFFEQAVRQALARKYEINVGAEPLDPAEVHSLSVQLVQLFAAAINSNEKIDCPVAGGAPEMLDLRACLNRMIRVEINVPSGVRSLVPDVPSRCREKGEMIARVYFLKPRRDKETPSRIADAPAGSTEDWLRRCHFDPQPRQVLGGVPKQYDHSSGLAVSSCGNPNGNDDNFSVAFDGLARKVKDNQGKQVLVVGYTDSTGRPESNLFISTGRANLVKKEILVRLVSSTVPTVSAIGRGEEVQSAIYAEDVVPESEESRRADVWLCPRTAR